jgi:hypothetical protein
MPQKQETLEGKKKEEEIPSRVPIWTPEGKGRRKNESLKMYTFFDGCSPCIHSSLQEGPENIERRVLWRMTPWGKFCSRVPCAKIFGCSQKLSVKMYNCVPVHSCPVYVRKRIEEEKMSKGTSFKDSGCVCVCECVQSFSKMLVRC